MQTKSLLIICCKCTHHPLSQVWEAFTCISDVSWYLLQKCVWGGGKKAMPVNVLAISPQFTAKEFELPAGATLGYWPHFSFRFTCWQVDCLLYNSSWKDILKKNKLNLSLNRLFSEFDCIEEIIWGREHQCIIWASVLQRCSLKQTRTELSVGAGPCLILSKSLRSSETPWSDVFRCLSDSLPSLRPSPAARVGDEDARVEWAESTVTQTAPGFCSGTSKLMCYISLIPFGFWHGTDFV